jgi:isocitrate dehydrogenase kinase/phosphatase
MTTLYFPSTWLYRHCAQWLMERELPLCYLQREDTRYIWEAAIVGMFGYVPTRTTPSLDLVNKFINERFNKV